METTTEERHLNEQSENNKSTEGGKAGTKTRESGFGAASCWSGRIGSEGFMGIRNNTLTFVDKFMALGKLQLPD